MKRRRADQTCELDDPELVVAFKQGVLGAYEEVVRRNRTHVEAVCTRILGNRDDADDATQETFLKAYRSLERMGGDCRLRAWLTTIATNVCLDEIRRRTRRVIASSLTDQQGSDHSEPGPEDLVDHDTLSARTLATMRPTHARALKLAYLLGFSHHEVGAHLEISSGQAKALLHRSRASFKRAWAIQSMTWT